MTKIKAITFDIDTTLTYGTSWTIITKELGASVKTHEFIYKELKENKISYQQTKEQLLNLWKATGNNNKDFFTKIFNNISLKKGAQEIITYLKSKGVIICLITGSVDLYAETIAKRLGIDNYFANTELVWDKNNKLIDFHYDINQSTKKLKQFKHFISQQKININDCYVVGDDENDIDLFKYTKKGIAIKSEKIDKLKPYAWKVINNLFEIKKLI